MLPEAEKNALANLQSCCRHQQIPLCGAIFPQLVYGTAFRRNGICLLRFDTMPYVILHDGLPHDKAGAADVAEMIAADVSPHLEDDIPATLFLMLDAMEPEPADPKYNHQNFPNPFWGHGERGANVVFCDGHAEWINRSSWNRRYTCSEDPVGVPDTPYY